MSSFYRKYQDDLDEDEKKNHTMLRFFMRHNDIENEGKLKIQACKEKVDELKDKLPERNIASIAHNLSSFSLSKKIKLKQSYNDQAILSFATHIYDKILNGSEISKNFINTDKDIEAISDEDSKEKIKNLLYKFVDDIKKIKETNYTEQREDLVNFLVKRLASTPTPSEENDLYDICELKVADNKRSDKEYNNIIDNYNPKKNPKEFREAIYRAAIEQEKFTGEVRDNVKSKYKIINDINEKACSEAEAEGKFDAEISTMPFHKIIYNKSIY